MPAAGWRRTAAAVVILAALPCAFFWRVLVGGQVLLPGAYLAHFEPWKGALPAQPHVYWNALIWDAVAQYLPWRAFAHRWLAQGVIPLWNPHQFCGTPFVANGQSALFYPLNLLFWLLEPAGAFGWAMALHFALGGLFAFAFLRALGLGRSGALLGGVAFQFCGFFIAWAELPTLVNVGIWLPLALLCIERFFRSRRMAYAVAGGAVIGMALLAGHPQMAFYLLLGTGAYFVFRWACDLRDGAGWRGGLLGLAGGAVALAVAAGLAAVQALPIVEMLPYSHRAGGTYQGYLRFAMPWRHLVTVALPDFFGRPTEGTYWDWPAGNYAELVAYVGLVPLLLAGLAVAWWRSSRCPRQVWFFAAAALLALLLAIGAPLNAIFFRFVPGFGGSGGPGRMLYLWATFVALLSGIGADALVGRLRRDERQRLAHDGAAAAGVLVAVTLALGLAAFASLPPARRPPPGLLADIARPSVVVFVVVILLWEALMVAAARRAVRAGVLAAGLLALTVADLFAFGTGYNPTSSRDAVYPYPPSLWEILLAQRPQGRRLAALYTSWPIGPDFPKAILPPNAATYYGVYDVAGYDSIYLQGYKDFLASLQGHDPSPPANGNMVLLDSLDLEGARALGVRQMLVLRLPQAPPPGRRGMAVVHLDRDVSSPRALTVPSPSASEPDAKPPGKWPSAPQIIVWSPNRLTIRFPPWSGPGRLILKDVRYPGWRVSINDRPLDTARLSGLFWDLPIRTGDSQAGFRYDPSTLRFGLFVSLCAVGLLAAVGTGVLLQRRPR